MTRIHKESINLIKRLYQQGLLPREISKKTNASYTTVWIHTRGPELGYTSRAEYQNHMARERQQKPINQSLSKLIKTRLQELGKTQKWLSDQLGVTKGAVSRHISGKTTPRNKYRGRLFTALELPYKTLDELIL